MCCSHWPWLCAELGAADTFPVVKDTEDRNNSSFICIWKSNRQKIQYEGMGGAVSTRLVCRNESRAATALGASALGFPAVRLSSCVTRLKQRWNYHSKTWCLLKLLEKPSVAWRRGMCCGQGARLCMFLSYFPSDFGILGLYLSSSSPSYPLVLFWEGCRVFEYMTVSFMGVRHEPMMKNTAGQTPEQSCSSQCHLPTGTESYPDQSLKVINVSGCLYSTVTVFTLQSHYRFHL